MLKSECLWVLVDITLLNKVLKVQLCHFKLLLCQIVFSVPGQRLLSITQLCLVHFMIILKSFWHYWDL